jgi:hypothetical protein
VVSSLSGIIKQYRPTAIIYPNAEDDHHDHWAASAFVQYTLAKLGYRTNEYTYLVHRRDYPWPPDYAPSGTLDPPSDFDNVDTRWEDVLLTPGEQRLKDKVISLYKVPRLVKEPFMGSFVRRNELLATTTIRKIEHVGTYPDPGADPMPGIVDCDPIDDSIRPSPGNSGELGNVGLLVNGPTLWAGVETAGNPSNKITYWFHVRLPGEKPDERVDVEIRNGQASYAGLAINSVVPRTPPRILMLEHRVWIELPASLLQGQSVLMLSIDSCQGNRHLDRTPWRRYYVQEKDRNMPRDAGLLLPQHPSVESVGLEVAVIQDDLPVDDDHV